MAKKSRFGANVRADVDRQVKEAQGFGYLNLPDDVKMFKPEGGTTYFDIMPYIVKDKHHPDANPDMPDSALPGNPWYKRPYWIHRDVGVDGETVVCPKSIGQKCPICEYREAELAKGTDWEELKEFKAKLRNLYVVIPINNKDFDEEMHIMDYSQHLFQNQLNAELQERDEYCDFPEPETGRTLRVRWTEKAFGDNSFYEAGRIDFEDRDQQYDEQWMHDAPCLDELLEVYSYKKLSAMLHGMDEADVVETTEEPETTAQSTRRQRKSKSASDRSPAAPSGAKTRRRGGSTPKEEEPAEESTTRRRRRDVETKTKAANRCPYGHVFGVEWDDTPNCELCNTKNPDTFDECGDEYEAQNS